MVVSGSWLVARGLCPPLYWLLTIYLRLRAGYRLPARQHAGILTQFQTKVNKKN